MENCLFCRIGIGEIPANIIFENDEFIAFQDIDPQAPVHILLIPKQHYSSLQDVPRENQGLLEKLMTTTCKIVAQENLAEAGYRFIINSGKDGGQAIPHLHAHILAGRKLQWPLG